MGNARWDPTAWTSYAKTTQAKTQKQIFTSTSVPDDLNPAKFDFRESVDSAANPESTPVIITCDVTGSMGHLAEQIVKHGLGLIMKEVYDRKPIHDPHILCGATGDTFSDRGPIQATQFEASVAPLTEQVERLWLEGNGGGNGGESYLTAWFLAAYKVKADAITKRGRKGYIFTIGDEPPHLTLPKEDVRKLFNMNVELDFTAKGLLDVLTPNWEVFHLAVGQQEGERRWRDLMGERYVKVSDWEKLPEIIVSTMQIIEGENIVDVANSWDGSTALVVGESLKALTASKGGTSGVVPI